MKKILIIIIVLVIAGGAVYLFKSNDGVMDIKNNVANEIIKSGATDEAISEIAKYKYTETFAHSVNKFSFKYPKGFIISSVPSEGVETILVNNGDKKIGVQIMISPFDGGDIDITSEIVKTDIPDMKISDAQELEIGNSRKGLAFVSDNPAFGGKSREVWFVFGGNLYQISTYYEFDDFLKGLFATWKFETK